MKKILIFLFVVFTSNNIVNADEWPWPQEENYYSENKKFVAHVTPPKYPEKTGSLLEVFEITNSQRVSLWQCKLLNDVAPVEVFVSNDGMYVITNNEWHKVGYGNYVVAFYGKNGLIRNYSMEQVLHLPGDISAGELFQLVPHSASSRWWDRNAIKFFDTYNGRLYFCIWLHLFDRWIAWNPANGKEIQVDNEMVKAWNSRARIWAVKQLQEKQSGNAPYEFLGKQKIPEDRPLIEQLLSNEHFTQTGRRSQNNHLLRYTAGSSKRSLAERILASWDGRATEKRSSSDRPLYYLGKLEGVVTLPETDDPNNATLWIYLIPDTIPEGQWHKQPPIQCLVASFNSYSFKRFDLKYTRKFPFCITTITPGQYRVKAVLDKTPPLSKSDRRMYRPEPGDYENIESPIINIQAGKTTKDLVINCITKVEDTDD
ncbi:MAG: hypothetical protein ACYSUX_00625 [Planctomycetota bacterium]